MDNTHIDIVFDILRLEVKSFGEPIVGVIARERDPFKVLVATILSLRTKDGTTAEAAKRLFALAANPLAMARLDPAAIEEAIYPVGFYKTKARTLIQVSRLIRDEHAGRVPHDIEALLRLPGVGRKTANLVVSLAFGGEGLCVDTHVHRITNRWGYVATKSPLETEMRLREILPIKYWKEINDFLVAYGQNLCRPVGPRCSVCRIQTYCDRVGVQRPR